VTTTLEGKRREKRKKSRKGLYGGRPSKEPKRRIVCSESGTWRERIHELDFEETGFMSGRSETGQKYATPPLGYGKWKECGKDGD